MLFSAAPTLADGCQPVIQNDGVVSAVIDPRTLRLDDGRDVRLAGVEVVAGEAANRQPALAGLIGRRVTLRGERDDPDRYGRQTAFIYLGPSASSVQSDLLARGDALVSADVTDKACAAELTAAETAARQARRGTWAEFVRGQKRRTSGRYFGAYWAVHHRGRLRPVCQAGRRHYISQLRPALDTRLCCDYFKAHDAILRGGRRSADVFRTSAGSGPRLGRTARRTAD